MSNQPAPAESGIGAAIVPRLAKRMTVPSHLTSRSRFHLAPRSSMRFAESFRGWIAPRLSDGGSFVHRRHGLMEIDWPARPASALDSRPGYVLNLFVEPAHRKRAVAQRPKMARRLTTRQQQKRAPSPEPSMLSIDCYALRGAASTSSSWRRPSSSGQLSFWLPSCILLIEIRDFEKSRA